ncbi:cytoskeletal protein RodZ [Rhodococcus sp. LBL1]|nr:cytoskeletal protein RodZ [Rhodococcus sp. LBL1]MDH6683187.1 cytoskeletal protein RodZ [Rhodococcus sp. LBL2]
MSPQEKMSQLWGRVPRRMFGGKMRTTTVVMCVLWLALAILNSYLNPPIDASKDPAPAAITETRPNPAQTSDTSQKSSASNSTTTTPPSQSASSSSVPAQSETSRSDRQPSASTTTPSAGHGTTTQQETAGQSTTVTESSKQTQESAATTAGAEASTVPSPAG